MSETRRGISVSKVQRSVSEIESYDRPRPSIAVVTTPVPRAVYSVPQSIVHCILYIDDVKIILRNDNVARNATPRSSLQAVGPAPHGRGDVNPATVSSPPVPNECSRRHVGIWSMWRPPSPACRNTIEDDGGRRD